MGTDVESVQAFFGFDGWPGQIVDIAVFDPHTGEPPLQLAPRQFRDLGAAAAAAAVKDRPGAHSFPDFVIFHGRCTSAVAKQLARLLAARLAARIAGYAPGR